MLYKPPIGFHTSDELWGHLAFICQNFVVESLYTCTWTVHTAIDNWPYPGLPTKMNNNQIICTAMNRLGTSNSAIILGAMNRTFLREWPKIVEKWPNLNTRYRDCTHSKIAFIKFYIDEQPMTEVYNGGSNFNTSGRNNSKWRDCTVRVDGPQRSFVLEHFKMLWDESEQISKPPPKLVFEPHEIGKPCD